MEGGREREREMRGAWWGRRGQIGELHLMGVD